MGGAQVQLMAYGKQDLYITGNPQISYFKYVYRRHENFAIETISHELETNTSINEFNSVASLKSHSGDMISKICVKLEFTAGVTMDNKGNSNNYLTFTNNTGHAYIKEASLHIGENEISKLYSEWFDIWNELTDPDQRFHKVVNKHMSKDAYYTGIKNTEEAVLANRVKYIEADDTLTCYVPLDFWISQSPGCALPVISLQHHDVDLHLSFRSLASIFNSNTTFSNPTTPPRITVLVDYIFLDTKERTRFASEKHGYLITQLQKIGPVPLTTSHDLNFNHPVKELVWVCRHENAGLSGTNPAVNGADFDGTINVSSDSANFGASWGKNDFFNYSCADRTLLTEVVGGVKSYEPFTYARLVLNNIDRFEKQRPSYFRLVQPSMYHSNIPNKHIYVYSFALSPEEFQPSGTCNFSRITKAQMRFDDVIGEGQEMTIIFFALNYNFLVIDNGQAGLRFSN